MTKIEWATLGLPKGVTWNPIRARNSATSKRGWHCEKVSPACEHCYAEALNAKAGDTGGTGLPYKPGHRQNGDTEIYLDEKTLLQPLSWRAPRGVFVCSMTDIFGDWVKDEWLDRIFAVMALCPQHRFALLTKRPARMREYFRERSESVTPDAITEAASDIAWSFKRGLQGCAGLAGRPLPNVWLGVTAEDQQRADERIPDLLATLAAVRFVSIEPMLGEIDLTSVKWARALTERFAESDDISDSFNALRFRNENQAPLDWVICGGESGPNARPMHPDWARSLRDQCKAAGVPFFFKQWGEWGEPTDGLHKLDWPYHPDYDRTHWFDARTCARPIEDGWSDKYHGGGALNPGVNLWKTPEYLGQVARCPQTSCREAGKCMGNEKRAAATRVGKARTGRLLDGKEYSEFPEAR